MHPILFEDRPEWYRLDFKNDLLYVECYRPALERVLGYTPQLWNSFSFKHDVTNRWGYVKSFSAVTAVSDDWVRFSCDIPMSDGRMFAIVDPLAASLSWFVCMLNEWDGDSGSQKLQVATLDHLLIDGADNHDAAGMGFSFSAEAKRRLQQLWRKGAAAKILQRDGMGREVLILATPVSTMKRVYGRLHNESHPEDMFGAVALEDGRLELVINPVACTCLTVEGSGFEPDDSQGYRLESHNIYNRGLQLTLLAGVASIWSQLATASKE